MITRRQALATLAAAQAPAPATPARFLEWTDLPEKARQMSGSPGRGHWDRYIRELDRAVRARVRRGAEDSVSELILTGRSFTLLPGVRSASSAWSADGLTAAARERVRAFVAAMQRPDAPERARWASTALSLQGRAATEQERILSANLARFARSQEDAEGLRLDAGWLVNHAVDELLRTLAGRAALPKRMARVAVVGPGLDVAGNPPGFDFYPMQTLQPFALLSSLLKLGAARLGDVRLTAFDLNPAVLEHVDRLARQGRAGQGRTLALVREGSGDAPAARYWELMLASLGAPISSSLGQKIPEGVSVRLVEVRPEALAAVEGLDLNVVCQTLRGDAGPYDLVVATGVLGFYAPLQQTQALTAMALLLAPGGVLIADARPPEALDALTQLATVRAAGVDLWAGRK